MIDIRLSDNLELMAEMQDNTVDLIYCDILYGTGKKFKDYQDLKPKREVIEQHYIPRIKEMHRVLKDTGSVYLQMDTRINHWIRCIMDDVFGYDNLLNEIYWCYKRMASRQKKFNNCTDVILWYSKGKEYVFNLDEVRLPYSQSSLKRQGYKKTNLGGGSPKSNICELNKKGKHPENHWTDIPFLRKNEYNTQKPKALIQRIVKASSNEGDLVADFYAGSFTTAEVCKDLNRNFIGCDISEKAVSIGLERTKY